VDVVVVVVIADLTQAYLLAYFTSSWSNGKLLEVTHNPILKFFFVKSYKIELGVITSFSFTNTNIIQIFS
jgi:hypothetical protein